MTELARPQPAPLPVHEGTQEVLAAELHRWWMGLDLAERVGVLRDVALANERRTWP